MPHSPLLPEWHAQVFEPASLRALEGLSQVGLVLFMFIVSAELRAPHGATPQLLAAAWIGGMSVLVPPAPASRVIRGARRCRSVRS